MPRLDYWMETAVKDRLPATTKDKGVNAGSCLHGVPE